MIDPALTSFAAIVVAGGQASRLGGADKATIEMRGRTLLEHTLDAVIDAAEVVVVGKQVVTDRPVTFVVEDPQYGGPVAGLLTGRDSLLRTFPWLAVLAVDMPFITAATIRRLHDAAIGHDGAVLVVAGGPPSARLRRRNRAARPGATRTARPSTAIRSGRCSTSSTSSPCLPLRRAPRRRHVDRPARPG